MKKILDYDMSIWALFFHMSKQARFVVESDKETGGESFINGLAQEIYRVMTDILTLKIKLPECSISMASRMDIAQYIARKIDPVIQTRKIVPSLLLFATVDYLYTEIKFPPIIALLGNNDTIKDFLSDFRTRSMDRNKVESLSQDAMEVVKMIVEPDIIKFKSRSILKKMLAEYKPLLDSMYGESEAHGRAHVLSVVNTALLYNQRYNVKCDPEEIILAGLFHDLFTRTDRDNHHKAGYDWVMQSMDGNLKDKEKRLRIAHAVLEHRAGYKGDYYSPLSELIASADRGAPDLNDILKRMYIHVKETNTFTRKGVTTYNTVPATHKEIIDQMLYHLEEKYSRKGYIQYTNIYMLEYKEELAIMLDQIDKVLKGKLKIVISNHNGLEVTVKRR